MKTIEKVKEAYNKEEYRTKLPYISSLTKHKAGFVFDREQSVRWNEEKVIEHNAAIDNLIAKRRDDQNRLDKQLEIDILDALKEEYKFNHNQAVEVYNYAYREHHDNMNNFFHHLDEIAMMVSKVIKM